MVNAKGPNPGKPRLPLRALLLAAVLPVSPALAGNRDNAALTPLLALNPALTGAGVSVAQPEASPLDSNNVSLNVFEVNPAVVGAVAPIAYINSVGTTASAFPNTIGSESSHADLVGAAFYGTTDGIAPGVAGVDNYDAGYFTTNLVFTDTPISAKVVNQSWILSPMTPSDAPIIEQLFDNYVVQQGVVICSAAGDGPTTTPPQINIQLPASAYNVIAVGAYNGLSSIGPTPTEGLAKPDITAIASATSYSTPIVAGVAAVLVQAGTLGLGGAGTQTAATDPRTIKALLLNGAEKNPGWANSQTVPLDLTNGAGLVNALRSYRILAGGQHAPTLSQPVALDALHPPIAVGAAVGPAGWNLQTIATTATTDAVDNYLIDLSNGASYVLTATLTWNRPFDQAVANNIPGAQVNGINNLDLFLYDTLGNPISASTSTVDNVEHIYVPSLPSGLYDLQVLKHGGLAGNPNWVSDSETYSVAWMASLLGDANLDGSVTFADFLILQNNYNKTGMTWQQGDFNHDGAVTFADFLDLQNNYNLTAGPLPAPASRAALLPALASAAAPEPAAALLLGVGCMTLLRRPRRAVRA